MIHHGKKRLNWVKMNQIFNVILKNALLASSCCYVAFLVTNVEELYAPLIAGFSAIILFSGVVSILSAGFFGWCNRQLPGRVINVVQGNLFLIFQILFVLFWVLVWFTYGNVNRPLEMLALGETVFSFLPLYIIAHSSAINRASKEWVRGVIFDIFITYVELIGTLFDIGLSFLTTMQSLLLTSFALALFSRFELIRLPKAGQEIDHVFHASAVLSSMIGMIGVFVEFSLAYWPLIVVGIIVSIIILLYLLWYINKITQLYFPTKIQEVTIWKAKAIAVVKKGLVIACIILLFLVIFVR